MGFHENLKFLLQERNLKQADLCRMTGIQTSLMSDYFGGKKSPTIKNAVLIADALCVSLDTLVGKENALNQHPNTGDKYTPHEIMLIAHYRKKPELQQAVDILLGIDEKD